MHPDGMDPPAVRKLNIGMRRARHARKVRAAEAVDAPLGGANLVGDRDLLRQPVEPGL